MKTLLMKKGPDLPRIAALVLVVILSSLSLEAFAGFKKDLKVGETFENDYYKQHRLFLSPP